MANSLLTIDMITNEALAIAHEKAQFLKTTDLQYDDQYAKEGGKIGSSLRIRKPNKYTVTDGRQLVVQDQNEQSGTLTVATQKHVGMAFNSADLTMKIDKFSQRYIEPAVAALVAKIESDYIAACAKAVWNCVGTAGTALTDLTVTGAARARLNQNLAPKDGNRFVQIDSGTMGGMVNGLKGLFQDSQQIKDQYREGIIGRTGGADWYENERLWTMPNSAEVAGEINAGTLTSGITSLTMDGLTAAPVEGMVFTIGSGAGEAGIYEINPETRAALPYLKQFVCAAGCTTTNLVFTPAIHYATTGPNAALQNCSGTPADNADIVFVGAASTSYIQPMMYHKEAFQFVSADLPVMKSGICRVKQYEGISLRVWQDASIYDDQEVMRIDALYGYTALRPEWACRMIGSANS